MHSIIVIHTFVIRNADGNVWLSYYFKSRMFSACKYYCLVYFKSNLSLLFQLCYKNVKRILNLKVLFVIVRSFIIRKGIQLTSLERLATTQQLSLKSCIPFPHRNSLCTTVWRYRFYCSKQLGSIEEHQSPTIRAGEERWVLSSTLLATLRVGFRVLSTFVFLTLWL